MRKVYSIYLILLMILSLASCGDDDDGYFEGKMSFGLFLMLFERTNYVLSDNEDGTLTLTVKDGYGNLKRSYIVKKCLQGQVYRSVENDCQGAGSSVDGWGALKLQYCNAKDNTCNPDGQYDPDTNAYVHGVNSEIWVSCDSDATAGLSWYPLTTMHTEKPSIDYIGLMEKYDALNQSLPEDFLATGVWSSETSVVDIVIAKIFRNLGDGWTFTYVEKILQKYTLCGTYVPN